MLFRIRWVLVVGALLFGACGDDGESAEPTSTTTSTTEATTTTTTIDTSVVPEEITIEYVQAVIDELYELEAEAVRMWWETEGRTVRGPVVNRLTAAFGTDGAAPRINQLGDITIRGEFEQFRDPPGPLTVTVLDLETVSSDCISAIATTSFEDRVVEPFEREAFFTLIPAETTQLRQVPWITNGGDLTEDGRLPEEDPCDA